MNILISGGTGFIGRSLCIKLLDKKHEVIVLTRNKKKAELIFGREVNLVDYSEINVSHFENVKHFKTDCIINLSGETIGNHRWDKKTKEKIISSRVNSTKALVEFIKNQTPEDRPKVFINASAIGYYGSKQDEELKENTSSGNDFLSDVCRQWEAEALKAEALGVRVVTVRTGVVLGLEGALKKMLLPFRFFVGGPLGNGRQWMSWIHIKDLVNVYYYALTNDKIKGAVNATSPNQTTMNDFSKTLGKVMHRPSLFRVPAFVLRLIFGEMADVLLGSQKVIPEKLIKSGFEFEFPVLEDALKDIITHS
jgi:uncharacterized protein